MLLPNQCSYASHQRIHQHKSPYTCPECGAICRSVHFQSHVTKNCLHYTRRVGFRSVYCSLKRASKACSLVNRTAFRAVCAHRFQGHTVIPQLTDPLGTEFICGRVGLCEPLWCWPSGPYRAEGKRSPSSSKTVHAATFGFDEPLEPFLSAPFPAPFSCHALCILTPIRTPCISVPLNMSPLIQTEKVHGPFLLLLPVEGLGVCLFLTSLFVEEPSTSDNLPLSLLPHYPGPGISLVSVHLSYGPSHCPPKNLR